MLEDIKKIIKAGTLAPSGDNVQPWRFVVNGNTIQLFNVPEKDNSLYNFKQNASMVANGAAIENMVIAAKEFRYKTEISLFPDDSNSNHVANLELFEGNVEKDSLYESIEKRATNRKPYEEIQLADEQGRAIAECARQLRNGEVFLAEGQEKVKKLGKLLSANEQVVLENKRLHNFLFSHVVWSEKEEMEKKSGLYIETLELGKPQKAMFKLVKNFSILKILNKLIKVSKKVAQENAEIYAKSSAIVAISTEGNTHKSYIDAGRLMQRVWLSATKCGLSVHPSTGVVLLAQRIRDGGAYELSEKHIGEIENAYVEIKNIFEIKNDTIKMILRIGNGGQPTARSSRQEPNIIMNS